MKFQGIMAALATGTFLFAGSTVLAQNRRAVQSISLAQIQCSSLNGTGQYKPINMDVTIGRQVFRAIAYLDGQKWDFLKPRHGVLTSEPAGVACRLALPNERPRFRTLTLAFGFADNGYQLDYVGALPATALNLEIYRDGKFYKSEIVRSRDAIRLPIDVTNTRSISIEATCLEGGNSFTSYRPGVTECPVLYFFEDLLE